MHERSVRARAQVGGITVVSVKWLMARACVRVCKVCVRACVRQRVRKRTHTSKCPNTAAQCKGV